MLGYPLGCSAGRGMWGGDAVNFGEVEGGRRRRVGGAERKGGGNQARHKVYSLKTTTSISPVPR